MSESELKHQGTEDDFKDYIKLKNPYGKNEGKVILILSLIFSIALLITIALLQFDEYDSYMKLRRSYLFYTGIVLCSGYRWI